MIQGFIDEADLLRRVSDGDRKAFTILYSRYLNQLYRYIYLFTKSKVTSEEIVQNIFIKIWTNRQVLKNITSFKGYLYRSAKNLLLDEIRKNQVQTKVHLTLKPKTEESHEESDAVIIYNQYYQIAQDAINLLPEKRKQIVELRIKHHLTLDEIAEELSISKGVVKKQLYAGFSFIKAYLRKHAEIEHYILPIIYLAHFSIIMERTADVIGI